MGEDVKYKEICKRGNVEELLKYREKNDIDNDYKIALYVSLDNHNKEIFKYLLKDLKININIIGISKITYLICISYMLNKGYSVYVFKLIINDTNLNLKEVYREIKKEYKDLQEQESILNIIGNKIKERKINKLIK